MVYYYYVIEALLKTEVRLDGWCEGDFEQPRNDGVGCAYKA